MNRNNFSSNQSKPKQWVNDEIMVGATYRLKPKAIGAKYGWPKIFTIIELQNEYFDGIEPAVEIMDIGAEKHDYFPRVVGVDEHGVLNTIALARMRRFENGEMKYFNIGNMESYEPI